jgi:predicted RND superfamily exporter protein
MIVEWILRHRKTILIPWLALALFFCAALALRLAKGARLVDNSVGIWFQQDDPGLARYREYNQRFGAKEWSVLLLETGSIYDAAFLKDLDAITTRLSALEHVRRVRSIANVKDNAMRADGELEYSRLYAPREVPATGDSAPPQAAAKGSSAGPGLARRLAANPVFENSLIRKGDTASTAVLIQTDNDLTDPDPFRMRLVDAIRATVKSYPSVKDFSLAGNLVVNAELNRASQRDVFVFYGLITALMTAFGWYTLRNFRDLAILFGTSVATVAPTMGMLALLGVPFNMITVMLPTVLIALVVPDVIHAIHDFHRLRAHGTGSLEAARESTRLLWVPSFWKSATDVVGFASFIPSTVTPIMQMGIYASLGVTLGWLATISAVPLLLVLLWPEGSGLPAIHEKELIRLPKDYLGFLWKHRVAVGLGFALMLLPIAGLPLLKVDTDYSKFFGKKDHITRSYERLKTLGYGQNPVIISLRHKDGKTYASEGRFASSLRFESGIKALPQVRKLLTPSDLLEQVDKAYNGTATSRRTFEGYGEAQVGQLLFLAELSGNDDLSEFLAEDKQAVQMVAMTDNMGSKGLKAFSAQVRSLAKRELGKDAECTVTGTSVLWANMDDQVATTELWSLVSAGVVLAIIFFVFLRSFRLGLAGIVINAVPVAGTLGLMGFLGIRVNIATALIAGIAMGIVVDNSLHFIIRMQAFVKDGMGWREGINATLEELGSSMIVSGIIIIGSFSCLITSNFTPTREFGVLLSANVLLSLFLDFAALPAIVYWVRPRGASLRPAPAAAGAQSRAAAEAPHPIPALESSKGST